MKTDQLIAALAADGGRVRAGPAATLAAATAAGLAVAGVGFALGLGARSDLPAALLTWRLPAKILLVAAAFAIGFAATLRASRPVAPGGGRGAGPVLTARAVTMLAVATLGAAMLVAEWASTPAAEAMARLVGRNAAVCLVAIPSLAALPLALLLAALRRAAPASPVLAGGCAGATAAMLAAMLYALHCTDDSPYFVLVWYALAALPPIGAGALFGARALDW